MVESQYYQRVRAQLRTTQESCEDSVTELMDCLDRLLQVLSMHIEEALTHSTDFISSIKILVEDMIGETLTRTATIEDQVDSVRLSYQTLNSMLVEENSILKSKIKRMMHENASQLMQREAEVTHLSLDFKTRTEEQEVVIQDLNQCLRDARTEQETLMSSVQVNIVDCSFEIILFLKFEQVIRSNLVAAVSDSDAWKKVAMQNSTIITSLELRIGKLQHELACEQAKTAQYQSTLSEMTYELSTVREELGRNYKTFNEMELELVETRSKIMEMCSKFELDALKNSLAAAEEQQASERCEHERDLSIVQTQLASRNQENADLLSSVQVPTLHSKYRRIEIDS